MSENHDAITKELISDISMTAQKHVRVYTSSPNNSYAGAINPQLAKDNLTAHTQCFFREEVLYFNNTPSDIYVTLRNGLRINIPYSSDLGNEDFIVRKLYCFRSETMRQVANSLKSLKDIDDGELLLIKQQLGDRPIPQYDYVTVMVDYHITRDELLQNNGSIYHFPTDLVISKQNDESIKHPFSSKFVNLGAFGKKNEYGGLKDLHIRIRYVNHNRGAKGKYVKILGDVFFLKPEKDAPCKYLIIKSKDKGYETKVFEDYIEVFYTSYSKDDSHGAEGIKSIRLSLAEAQVQWGITNTYEEAARDSNEEAKHKQYIRELEFKTEKLKGEIQHEKAEFDRAEAKRKIELSEIAFETERLKQTNIQQKQDYENLAAKYQKQSLENKEMEEKLRRERAEFDERVKRNNDYWRDYYEHRNYERKDKSESIKFIAAVTIAVMGLVTAMIKLQPKPSQ